MPFFPHQCQNLDILSNHLADNKYTYIVFGIQYLNNLVDTSYSVFGVWSL